MKGRCIMMCAGEFRPMEIDAKPDDWVIAVDGGLKYLEDSGIVPDFLLGDFDSLGAEYAETVAKYRAMGDDHFRQFPVVKDDTDTMAAARLGISRGYKEFLIYGGLGGRLDHTMANIQTIVWILRKLRSMHPDAGLHDFRILRGEDRPAVSFDAQFPFEYKENDEAIVSALTDYIAGELPGYQALIRVDRI